MQTPDFMTITRIGYDHFILKCNNDKNVLINNVVLQYVSPNVITAVFILGAMQVCEARNKDCTILR